MSERESGEFEPPLHGGWQQSPHNKNRWDYFGEKSRRDRSASVFKQDGSYFLEVIEISTGSKFEDEEPYNSLEEAMKEAEALLLLGEEGKS